MIFLSTKGTKCHTYTIKQKGEKYMSNQIKMATVKVLVHDTMKAKLKATAALNSMTMGDLFMDAVLEKYPYLKKEVGKGGNDSNRQQFQHKLEEILSELAQNINLTESEKNKLNEEKQMLKEKIRSLDGDLNGQER